MDFKSFIKSLHVGKSVPTYFLVLNEMESITHNGHLFQYKDGLNVVTGILFSDSKSILRLLTDNSYYIREVEVPKGAKVISDSIEKGILQANSLFLHEKRSLLNIDTWQWLSEQGVDVTNILHKIVLSGNINIAKMLIDNGANLNNLDEDGWSVMECAVHKKNIDMVKLLLDSGVSVKDEIIYNTFYQAAHYLEYEKYRIYELFLINKLRVQYKLPIEL